MTKLHSNQNTARTKLVLGGDSAGPDTVYGLELAVDNKMSLHCVVRSYIEANYCIDYPSVEVATLMFFFLLYFFKTPH